MKVVAFNASARPGGNTAQMIQQVFVELEKEGIETELVEMAGSDIHGCRACQECKTNKDGHCSDDSDKINEYIDKMVAADGIILGSPTYFANLTTEMKALIDRAGYVVRANDNLLARKVGASVSAVRRAGSITAIDAMNRFFQISQVVMPSASYWNIGYGLEPGDVQNDKEGMDTMANLGQNMAWLMKKVSG
jgi:multimeric flavodoxin WrbA